MQLVRFSYESPGFACMPGARSDRHKGCTRRCTCSRTDKKGSVTTFAGPSQLHRPTSCSWKQEWSQFHESILSRSSSGEHRNKSSAKALDNDSLVPPLKKLEGLNKYRKRLPE